MMNLKTILLEQKIIYNLQDNWAPVLEYVKRHSHKNNTNTVEPNILWFFLEHLPKKKVPPSCDFGISWYIFKNCINLSFVNICM
jgi:hypothetical protein